MEYNNEEYPRLTPPIVVYEGKAALKKPAVIPLWVKTCAAAASVALLVALFFRHPARTELELMAELSPICSTAMAVETPLNTTGQRAHFVMPKVNFTAKPSSQPTATTEAAFVRPELPMIAVLESAEAPALNPLLPVGDLLPGDFAPALAMAQQQLPWDEDDDRSLLQRGFLMMTDGQYNGLGEMILTGWRSMKQELSEFNDSMSESIVALKSSKF